MSKFNSLAEFRGKENQLALLRTSIQDHTQSIRSFYKKLKKQAKESNDVVQSMLGIHMDLILHNVLPVSTLCESIRGLYCVILSWSL
jgi:hypothetical protein